MKFRPIFKISKGSLHHHCNHNSYHNFDIPSMKKLNNRSGLYTIIHSLSIPHLHILTCKYCSKRCLWCRWFKSKILSIEKDWGTTPMRSIFCFLLDKHQQRYRFSSIPSYRNSSIVFLTSLALSCSYFGSYNYLLKKHEILILSYPEEI